MLQCTEIAPGAEKRVGSDRNPIYVGQRNVGQRNRQTFYASLLGDPPWLPLRPKQGKGGATETALNYEAFRLYYTARVDRRSLRHVALQVNKSPKLLERWSRTFHWNQRAEACNRHLEELRQEVQEALEQEVAQIRAERLEQRREEINSARRWRPWPTRCSSFRSRPAPSKISPRNS